MSNSERSQRRTGTRNLINVHASKPRTVHVCPNVLFTFLLISLTRHSSIKIATTTQSPSQALANIQKALPAIIANIKGGWNNVQSLHLKTGESVALPLWTCELGEEGRWDGLVKDGEETSEGDESASGEDNSDVDEGVAEDKKEAVKRGKGIEGAVRRRSLWKRRKH